MMRARSGSDQLWWLLVACVCLLSGCSRGEVADSNRGEIEGARLTKYVASGNEGSLGGVVAFDGIVPEPNKIVMDADPACQNPEATAEDMAIVNGKLQNVFVYVQDGRVIDNRNFRELGFEIPTEIKILDQKACRYSPHVLGVQTGQQLLITNSDPTVHNINARSGKNRSFNEGQTPGAPPISKSFAQSEIVVAVKCNQHPWMRAYIGVVAHPFYAVSAADGTFEIKNLPPGTYTLAAWHERLGTRTQTVTINDRTHSTIEFRFEAGKAH